ncbi:MAG: aminotransferase class I/II-fold pyridoxal phosphate-dependent enzyme [Cyanobacteria bacterium J06554_6]
MNGMSHERYIYGELAKPVPFFMDPTGMPLSQNDAPLVEALSRSANRPHAAFYTPGHKRGQGISKLHQQAFGPDIFRADLPELPELDNLFAPNAVIQQAQALAAEAFGAEQTWFLANGSTCGIEAAILAVCNPGDKIIVPRNAHRSVIAGLVLAGAMPVFIMPEYRADWGIALGLTPATVAAALAKYPDVKAVLLVSPSYEGICVNVGAIADLAHHYGCPLIVDEAHGPHFAFHPELPCPALEAGADLVVQSAHKVLAAFTQAALLHRQFDRVCLTRLTQALQLTQSTSPSYLLLASLDAARHQMALSGQALMTQTLQLARAAAAQLSPLAGLQVLTGQSLPAGQQWDATRLTLRVTELGLTGWAADEYLHSIGVTAELPAAETLTFIISLGNTPDDIDRLVAGCQKLCGVPQERLRHRTLPAAQPISAKLPALASLCPSEIPARAPRAAFFARNESCPLTAAIGRISADTICPYPPGIPVLIAGESVTAAVVDYLQMLAAAGGELTGLTDRSLASLRVLLDDGDI